MHRGAGLAGGPGQLGEIDVDGDVRLARILQRIGEGVAADGLERVGEAGPGPWHVVDRERRPAGRDDARGERRHHRRLRRAISSTAPSGASQEDRRVRIGREAEVPPPPPRRAPLRVEPTIRSRQAPLSAHQLAYGQRVEELVADGDERHLRHVLEPCVPEQLCPSGTPASVAACFARKTGLVSTRCTRAASRKPGAMRAARQRVRHQRAAARPSSTSAKGAGDPEVHPGLRRPPGPTSFPNIWLISGAVTKSPAMRSGSRVM